MPKSKKAKGSANKESDGGRGYENVERKTVEAAETIIAQFTLLYTENTSMAVQVQKMNKTIQEEQQIKEEIS